MDKLVKAKSIYQPILGSLKTVFDRVGIEYRMLQQSAPAFIDVYIHLNEHVIMNPELLKSLDYLPDHKPEDMLNEHILTSTVKTDIKNIFHTAAFIGGRYEDDGLDKGGFEPHETVLCLTILSSKYKDADQDLLKVVLTNLSILDKKDAPTVNEHTCYCAIDDYYYLPRTCNELLDRIVENMGKMSTKKKYKDKATYLTNFKDILSKHRILLQMPSFGEIIPLVVERTDEVESIYNYNLNQIFMRQVANINCTE